MADNPDKEPTSTPSAEDAPKEHHEETTPLTPPPTPPMTLPSTPNQDDGPRQEKRDRLERWKFRVEVTTAVIIALYTGIAAWQLNEMRKATRAATKSADTAKDTLIRSQRPWLVNDGPATYKVGSFYKEQDSAGVDFTFQVKNFGSAPGLDVGEGLQPFVRTSGDMRDFDTARKQACQLADGIVNVNSETIFPQQTVSYSTGAFIPNFSKVRAALFYGCIAYRDQFDTMHTTHHTTFCVFGPIKEPHSLAICGVDEIAD